MVLGIFAATKFAIGNLAARKFAVGKLAAWNFHRTTWCKLQLAPLTEQTPIKE